VVTPNRSMDWAKSLAHEEEREHDQRGEYESRRWPEGVYGASHHRVRISTPAAEKSYGGGGAPTLTLPRKRGREIVGRGKVR